MTTLWKQTTLCALLTILGLALLMQASSSSAATTYGREKLKGSTSSQGDFSKERPNIIEAQNLTAQACDKVANAQKAGEWDKAGHAQKAKSLLEQARNELKLAADTSSAIKR
jgi:hypothetical protein